MLVSGSTQIDLVVGYVALPQGPVLVIGVLLVHGGVDVHILFGLSNLIAPSLELGGVIGQVGACARGAVELGAHVNLADLDHASHWKVSHRKAPHGVEGRLIAGDGNSSGVRAPPHVELLASWHGVGSARAERKLLPGTIHLEILLLYAVVAIRRVAT